jgi:hypothetical protein
MVIRREAAVANPDVAEGDLRSLDKGLELALAIRLKHRQGAVLIEAPTSSARVDRIDRALVRGICLARDWAKQLATGEVASINELARRAGLCNHYTARLLPLAWLAPDLVTSVMEGRQSPALSLSALVNQPLPMDWDEQLRLFAEVS